MTDKKELAQVARDPEVLCPGGKGRREGVAVVDTAGGGLGGGGGGGEVAGEGGELDISVIVNQHASVASSADVSPEVSF